MPFIFLITATLKPPEAWNRLKVNNSQFQCMISLFRVRNHNSRAGWFSRVKEFIISRLPLFKSKCPTYPSSSSAAAAPLLHPSFIYFCKKSHCTPSRGCWALANLISFNHKSIPRDWGRACAKDGDEEGGRKEPSPSSAAMSLSFSCFPSSSSSSSFDIYLRENFIKTKGKRNHCEFRAFLLLSSLPRIRNNVILALLSRTGSFSCVFFVSWRL